MNSLRGTRRDFDVIASGCVSGDAIPLHLLTAESGEVYRQHLASGGCLLIHISNRSLDLEPVTRGLAANFGWSAVLFAAGPHEDTGESGSHWVLITANSEMLRQPAIAARYRVGSAGSHPMDRRFRQSLARRPFLSVSLGGLRRWAATSMFFIVIIASKARFASAPPTASASVSVRGVICQERPQRSLHQPHALSLPPFPTIAFQ